MRYSISIYLLVSFLHLQAQSPGEIAQKICDRYIERSNLELVEKPLDHIQQGILIINPNRGEIYEIETIMTVGEFGGRYVTVSANPGEIEIWRDEELIFNGQVKTRTTPLALDDGLFMFEFRELLPPFPGDYKIKIHFTPSEEANTIFLWLTDEKGITQSKVDFRSDWDFTEAYPYRYQSRKSNEKFKGNWCYPTSNYALDYESGLNINDWHSYTGVVLDAMWQVSDHFELLDYKKFVQEHLDFFVESIEKVEKERKDKSVIESPFFRYFRYRGLDDFGPQTVPFLNFPKNEDYQRFISKGLNRIMYKSLRLSDGSFARYTPDSLTVWAEDLYMGTVLLSRAYIKYKDRKYLEETIKQIILFDRRLKDRYTGLYWHGYSMEKDEHSSSKWAGANGLALLAKVELLKAMPENHPERESVLKIFRDHAASIRERQSIDGRWHQVLDNEDTYLETSSSAMFVRAFAEGVTNKWLHNRDEFKKSAISGWLALTSQIDESGNVSGISKEPSILFSDEDYQDQKTITNEMNGLGAVLYACIAINKMEN